MHLLLPLIYFVLCILLIQHVKPLRIAEFTPAVSSTLFTLKIIAGLALWFIYSYHYTLRNTSDAFKYFDDAWVLHKTLSTNPTHYWQMLTGYNDTAADLIPYYKQMYNWVKPWNYGLYNDNRIIIRANALCMLLSNGNYFVHIVLFNFVGYIGLVYLYNFFRLWCAKKLNSLLIVVAVFLTPSMLFWNSGVLKEPLLLFCLGVMLYNFYSVLSIQFTPTHIIKIGIVLLCAYALAHLKVYLLPCILVLMVLMSIEKYISNYSLKIIFPACVAIVLVIIVAIQLLLPQYNLLEILRQKQFDFNNMALTYKAGSYIALPTYNGNAVSLLTLAPKAIYNTLLMPTFSYCTSAMMGINLAENGVMIALFIYLLFYFDRPSQTQRYRLFAALMFVACLATIIGISTPVIGAIVRYKIPLLPFVFIILFSCISTHSPLIKFIEKWQIKLRS